MSVNGRVIAAHGRQYVVELDDGRILPCFPRGKKSEIACGDQVEIVQTTPDQGVVERIHERHSLLYRSNEYRQKLIAANVDQIIIVVATEPAFSDDLITRALLAAESQDIGGLIVLNKCDVTERLAAARERLMLFSNIGYPVIELSALSDGKALLPHLLGKTSVLMGQSGMGKSTMINALIPGARAATREISTALDTGKHTTTHACLYHLDANSHLIDSPGLQEFGLGHLPREILEAAFVEFRPYRGQCRFRNCRHDREPGCALHLAISEGKIAKERLAVYRRILSA